MSRTENAVKIVAAGIMQQIIIVICGLILPPLIIFTFGSEVNGLVSTIKQMLTYFNVVNLGIGASCQVALYKPLANKDYETVNGVLGATRIFFNRTGYVYTALIIGFAIIFPFVTTSKLTIMHIASVIIITGAGSVCEYIFVSKYKILLVADQKQYIVSKIQAEGTIVNTVASVVMIYLGANIVIVQLIATLVYILRLFWIQKYIKKNYSYANYHTQPRFDLIKNRWQAFVFQISDMIISYTPMILTATIISLTEASIYSVYNMIFSSLSMIIGVFSSGFAPAFGNLMAEKNNAKLEKAYKTFGFVYNLMAFWATTCAMVLICSFVSVYITDTKGVNYVIPSLAVLFSLQSLFRNIRTPSNTIVQAAGRFKDNQIPNLVEAGLNVLLAIILGKLLGLEGIILSGVITGGVRSLIFIWYSSKKIIGNSPFKDYLIIVADTGIMFVIYFFTKIPDVNNYFQWILQGIKVALISALAFIVVNSMLDSKAALDAFHRFKTILAKRR